MSAISFLNRLDRVKQTGAGRWIACCPAHDDRNPSLSICEQDDGMTLVHCFAGCHVDDVMDAVGLSVSDLFPDRIPTPAREPHRLVIPAKDILVSVAKECMVVAVAGMTIAERGDLNIADIERVALAANRIQAAVRYAHV